MTASVFPIIEITPYGFHETEKDLMEIAVRMTHAEPAFEEIIKVLEKGEARIFERYHGKYVRTGALKESLTEDAGDAIREAHGEYLDFGTKVWYAQFQKTPAGKSAVLKLLPTERRAASKILLHYAVHGVVPVGLE